MFQMGKMYVLRSPVQPNSSRENQFREGVLSKRHAQSHPRKVSPTPEPPSWGWLAKVGPLDLGPPVSETRTKGTRCLFFIFPQSILVVVLFPRRIWVPTFFLQSTLVGEPNLPTKKGERRAPSWETKGWGNVSEMDARKDHQIGSLLGPPKKPWVPTTQLGLP